MVFKFSACVGGVGPWNRQAIGRGKNAYYLAISSASCSTSQASMDITALLPSIDGIVTKLAVKKLFEITWIMSCHNKHVWVAMQK